MTAPLLLLVCRDCRRLLVHTKQVVRRFALWQGTCLLVAALVSIRDQRLGCVLIVGSDCRIKLDTYAPEISRMFQFTKDAVIQKVREVKDAALPIHRFEVYLVVFSTV